VFNIPRYTSRDFIWTAAPPSRLSGGPPTPLQHPRTPVAMLGPPSLLSTHSQWLFTLRLGSSASLDLRGVLSLCTLLPLLRLSAAALRSAHRCGCARLPLGHRASCRLALALSIASVLSHRACTQSLLAHRPCPHLRAASLMYHRHSETLPNPL
jgi:hypothetical protein